MVTSSFQALFVRAQEACLGKTGRLVKPDG